VLLAQHVVIDSPENGIIIELMILGTVMKTQLGMQNTFRVLLSSRFNLKTNVCHCHRY